MRCVHLNWRICSGFSGVGSAAEDFRDGDAEIERAANSPIGDWRIPDFLIGDEDFAARTDLVIGDDRMSTAAEIVCSEDSPISDWRIEPAGKKPVTDWLICG